MKIIVMRRSNETVTLDLQSPLTINGHRLTDASGTDYFFNEDGTYDGWGREVHSQTEAEQIMRSAKVGSMVPPKVDVH